MIWVCAFCSGAMSSFLLLGVAAWLHTPPAIAFYKRIEWEPTPSLLGIELLMVGTGAFLFFAGRRSLKLTPVG